MGTYTESNEIKKQYKEETGFDVYEENKNSSFTDEYVYWLQDKIVKLQKKVPKKSIK